MPEEVEAPRLKPALVIEVVDSVGAVKPFQVRNDVFADILDRVGLNQQAADIRGERYEDDFMQRATNVMRYSPTVGDVIKVSVLSTGVWLVYEGVRYLLRNTIDMPGFLTFADVEVAPVRRIRTATAAAAQ